MSKTELEKKVLNLPPAEREQLAIAAWESLETNAEFVSDRTFDPKGIDLALIRDDEIESGSVKPISHAEFRKVTSGESK